MHRITQLSKGTKSAQRMVIPQGRYMSAGARLAAYEDTGLTPEGCKWFSTLLLRSLKECDAAELHDYLMKAIRTSDAQALFLDPEEDDDE